MWVTSVFRCALNGHGQIMSALSERATWPIVARVAFLPICLQYSNISSVTSYIDFIIMSLFIMVSL